MCLIIYAPHAQEIPRDHFWQGATDNNDGIGIMSIDGVEKFIGRKQCKRAYAYARQLVAAGIPYAVHFRFATHGKVGRDNTHPFEIPGTDWYMMHNGILWTASLANEEVSDTAVFAHDVMPGYMARRGYNDPHWMMDLEDETDYSKLLLLNMATGEVELVNQELGYWIAGLWYSNPYSVPAASIPASRFYGSPLPVATQPDMTETEAVESWYARANARHPRQTGRSGFDWHDRTTWDDYPLPGSWEERFPLAEDKTDDGDDRMAGVQQYI